MLSNPLTTYANTYNFEILDECAYGTVDSFLVSVRNDGYKKAAFINFFTPETDEGDAMLKMKLSESIKALELDGVGEYEVLINGIDISTNAELVEFDKAIHALCALLTENGFLPMPVCSECGYTVEEGAPSFISVIDNRAAYMCDECTEEVKGTLVSNDEQKLGSKKRGVLGAVCGALLSFIIVLVLFIFVIPANGFQFGKEDADVISAAYALLPSAALLTVLTFLGYRLFTKRKGAERLLPCFLISTGFTIASAYLSMSVVYTNFFKLGFSSAIKMLGTIIGAPITDPHYRADFIQKGLLSLAIVIAVTLIYSLIFDTKKPQAPVFIPVGNNDEIEQSDVLADDGITESDDESVSVDTEE